MTANLNHLIQKKNVKIFFRVESVADLNTAKGFIEVLGIKRKHVVISYGAEATRMMAQAVFKGCSLTTSRRVLSHYFPVKFDTEGRTRLMEKNLIVNYDPYKYCLSARISSKEKIALRRAMRIKKSRKVIAASCSTRDEVDAILKAYRNLNLSERPLLIFGLRRADAFLSGSLNRRGFRTHDRRFLKQDLSYFGRSDIVVLNTMGELFKFLGIADLAIVGHDRNIFEPALLGVPILYFGSPLNMSQNDKQMASLFGLFWRKNSTAKSLLDRTGGARRIDLTSFHHQITNMLRFPDRVIRGTRKAVRLFHRQVIPSNRLRGARLLVSAMMAKSTK